MDTSVEAFDLQRIFLGDVGWWFTLEVVFRTTVMLVFTYLLVRTLGRRTAGQLSLVEFLLVVAIGSAVGDPMFYADVPLVHGMAVIAVTVVLNRGLAQLILRSQAVEDFVEGMAIRLIEDGVLDVQGLRAAELAEDELFERLRLREVAHLGQVRAAYAEPNGELSVFRTPPGAERVGLPIEPPSLAGAPEVSAELPAPATAIYACRACGRTRAIDAGAHAQCDCGGAAWTRAVGGSEQEARTG